MKDNCRTPTPLPAPQPPWLRPVQSPFVQTVTGVDIIDLGVDLTILTQVNQQLDNAPYRVVLPIGNYIRQYKQILIQGSQLGTTAPFQIFGSSALVGSASLILDPTHSATLLMWDGTMWQVMGGNAQPSDLQ